MGEIEVYVHIPFCIRKCNYCDFLSFPSRDQEIEEYVKALCLEIEKMGKLAATEKVSSIFIGGGTPSLLKVDQTERILGRIIQSFQIRDDAEISMEANPGSLTREKLEAYRKMGINRLSIGLQSTEDSCLRKLGRIHTFAQFKENYETARAAGFENINIDLMSALPGQTLESYRETLKTVVALKPEHISAYSLILEEGTPFYEDDALTDQLPDEEIERKMYEMTREILEENNYFRYEISNYALPGKECRHNLGYWDDVPYIGLGLGASSYWKGARFSNETDLKKYIAAPFVTPKEREDYHRLSEEEQMEEYMFLGLRKNIGVSTDFFEKRFGASISKIYGEIIKKYIETEFMEFCDGRLRLTDSGIDVSNHIFSEFLIN